jgi:hypothetical protein
MLDVSPKEERQGEHQVDFQPRCIARVVAVTLLVGLATAGCARSSGSGVGNPAASTPTAQSSQAGAAASTIAPASTGTATAGPTQTANPTTAAVATKAAAATTDPLDDQLSNIDNLLNGVDNSISGGATGASGGE